MRAGGFWPSAPVPTGWRRLIPSSGRLTRKPHGQAEAPGLDPARQPILLTGKLDNQNRAEALVLMDGTKAPVDAPYTRCMVMFDDGDTDTRSLARQQFKAAKDAGLVTRYFQQTPNGGWQEAGR